MYYLIDKQGNSYGPIVADDPRKDTYRDSSIQAKVVAWANKLGYTWKREQ